MRAFEKYEICRGGGITGNFGGHGKKIIGGLDRLENLVINPRNFRFREDGGKRSDLGMFDKRFV